MTWTPSLTRDSGFCFDQSMPYCASSPKLPDDSTTSARPFVSSSSVAVGLGDQARLAEHDRGDAGTHPDVRGLVRCGGEQQPEVLVPGLVGGVDRVEAELVGELDRLEGLRQRVVREHHVAELHDGTSRVGRAAGVAGIASPDGALPRWSGRAMKR